MKKHFVVAVIVAFPVACSDSSSSTPPASDAGTEASSTCPPSYAECDGNPNTVCETRLDADALHCGACGHVCLAGAANQKGTCNGGACRSVCDTGFADCDRDPANGCEAPFEACNPTTLAIAVGPGGIAVDGQYVYYASKAGGNQANAGWIAKVPKTGGPTTTLAENQNRPLGIVADAQSLFWSNGGELDKPDGSIASVRKNGGQVTVIASGITRPSAIALLGDRVYWTSRDPPNGTISSAKKDGTDLKIVVTNLVAPADLVVTQGVLVWSTSGAAGDGSDALIERAKPDGTERTTLAQGLPNPSFGTGILPDSILVGSRSDGTVRRIPLLPIAQPPPLPTPLFTDVGEVQELLVSGTRAYATTGKKRSLVALPIDGGEPLTLAADMEYPSYIATDGEAIYWTDGQLVGPAAIKRLLKPK
jgi:hypothetical protein